MVVETTDDTNKEPLIIRSTDENFDVSDDLSWVICLYLSSFMDYPGFSGQKMAFLFYPEPEVVYQALAIIFVYVCITIELICSGLSFWGNRELIFSLMK